AGEVFRRHPVMWLREASGWLLEPDLTVGGFEFDGEGEAGEFIGVGLDSQRDGAVVRGRRLGEDAEDGAQGRAREADVAECEGSGLVHVGARRGRGVEAGA